MCVCVYEYMYCVYPISRLSVLFSCFSQPPLPLPLVKFPNPYILLSQAAFSSTI